MGKGNRLLQARENRLLGRAMHEYAMLKDGDRVLVAVSGGIDSLVLAAILNVWQKKAPIAYDLHCIHVDMAPWEEGPGEAAQAVVSTLTALGLAVDVVPALWQLAQKMEEKSVEKGDNGEKNRPGATTRDWCFLCARSRRTQLFEYAREHNFSSIALGHHRDDIIETFLLNITSAGNISTMRPKQDLFDGKLSLIRPLAYLDKDDIEQIGQRAGIQALATSCPLDGHTRRQEIHELAQLIYTRIPGAKEHIFSALGNVRADYLLGPVVSSS